MYDLLELRAEMVLRRHELIDEAIDALRRRLALLEVRAVQHVDIQAQGGLVAEDFVFGLLRNLAIFLILIPISHPFVLCILPCLNNLLG